MERNDTISSALAIIGYIVMAGGLILGALSVAGGGILYFVLAVFFGIANGMLFVGLAFILNKLDNLADLLMEQKAVSSESKIDTKVDQVNADVL